MTLLAGLDIATTTGIAIIRGDHLVFTDHRRFVDDDDNDDGAVFYRAAKWLSEIMGRFDVTEMAVEETLRTNSTRSKMVQGPDGPKKVSKPIGTDRTYKRLGGLRGVMLLALRDEALRRQSQGRGLSYREVNVRTWRSGVYGKCSPPKTVSDSDRSKWWKQKALAQCKLFRWDITQTDAAEAAMIAEWLRITRKQERLGFMAKDDAPDLFGPKKKMETPF